MIALRKAVLEGQQYIHGLLFDLTQQPVTQIQRRILQLWHQGDQVFRLPQALFLLFNQARWQDCEQALAYPINKTGPWYCAFPVTEKQLQAQSVASGSILFFRSGTLQIHPPSHWHIEDLATWINSSEYQIVSVQALGELPQAPARISASSKLTAEALFNNPNLRPATALQSLLLDLQHEAQNSARSSWSNWFSALPDALRQLRRSNKTAPVNTNISGDKKPGVWHKIQAMTASFLLSSRLSKAFSWRQAQYFRKLVRMFDDGDLGSALRHAIPLSTLKDGLAQQLRPAMGRPRARDSLRISTQRSNSAFTYDFGEQFFNYLKRQYRASFERLDQLGKVQEAAFVLAELLQEVEEAVAYLESHSEYQLAAELAEGRDARPGLVVRQWLLAKDYKRAIRIARRSKVFAETIQLLEQNQATIEEAKKLRIIWANTLAEAGDYASAVDAIWPLAEAQSLVHTWLDQAIALGGPMGARMLVRKLVTFADAYDECLPLIQDLFNDSSVLHSAARSSFAKALLKESTTVQSRTIARLVLRSLLRDHCNQALHWKNNELRRLASFCSDSSINADMPNLRTLNPVNKIAVKQLTTPLVVTLSDFGTLALHDVCLLANSDLLLALGEVGVQIRHASGTLAQRFSLPAQQLIAADSGNRFITIAHRGEAVMLGRIWLEHRKATAWHNVRLQHWADSFDGNLWFVAHEHSVMAVDSQSEKFDILWQVSDLPGHVVKLFRTTRALCLLLAVDDGLEYWHYELPALMLRQRYALAIDKFDLPRIEWLALNNSATLLFRRVFDANNSVCDWELLHYYSYSSSPTIKTLGFSEHLLAPLIAQDWLMLPVLTAQGIDLHILDISQCKTRLQIHLPAAKTVSAKLQDNKLVVCDNTGRVYIIDLDTSICQLQLCI